MEYGLLPDLERITLSLLCSKGYLARDEVESAVCTELEKKGLTQRTLIGGWIPTCEGRRMNEKNEHS